MNLKRTSAALCMIFLLICLPGLTMALSKKEKIEQAYKDFFSMVLNRGEINVMALGVHSNILVRTKNKTLLFDPTILMKSDLEMINAHGVDLVLYTHGHGDHFDKNTALKLFKASKPYTVIDPSLATDLEAKIPPEKLIITVSGKSHTAGDITIDAIEGKHIGPIMLFRVRVNGVTIFHGGDSAYVPLSTMASDLAFVPTGYPSPTCRPKYAFKMVSDIQPKIAVPMHGGDSEHIKFTTLVEKNLPSIKVSVLAPYHPQKLAIH